MLAIGTFIESHPYLYLQSSTAVTRLLCAEADSTHHSVTGTCFYENNADWFSTDRGVMSGILSSFTCPLYVCHGVHQLLSCTEDSVLLTILFVIYFLRESAVLLHSVVFHSSFDVVCFGHLQAATNSFSTDDLLSLFHFVI